MMKRKRLLSCYHIETDKDNQQQKDYGKQRNKEKLLLQRKVGDKVLIRMEDCKSHPSKSWCIAHINVIDKNHKQSDIMIKI